MVWREIWVYAKCGAYIVLLILEQWISSSAVPTKLHMSLLYALCIILCKKCNVFRLLLSSQLSLQGLSFLVLSCGSFPKFSRESSCYLPPLPLDSAAQPNNGELNWIMYYMLHLSQFPGRLSISVHWLQAFKILSPDTDSFLEVTYFIIIIQSLLHMHMYMKIRGNK